MQNTSARHALCTFLNSLEEREYAALFEMPIVSSCFLAHVRYCTPCGEKFDSHKLSNGCPVPEPSATLRGKVIRKIFSGEPSMCGDDEPFRPLYEALERHRLVDSNRLCILATRCIIQRLYRRTGCVLHQVVRRDDMLWLLFIEGVAEEARSHVNGCPVCQATFAATLENFEHGSGCRNV